MKPPRFVQENIFDPSQLHRPEAVFDEFNALHNSTDLKNVGKDKEKFRIYDIEECQEHVRKTYQDMHVEQTVSKVNELHKKWTALDHAEMTIMDAVIALDNLVDQSDPDCDLPNSVHAFQTAERIREKHPDKDWFQLVGLIHDIGKVMALFGEPQHFVVGDTFPVGCKFSDKIVFAEQFLGNPDTRIPEYSSKLGIYEENCGLDNVMMSWGHDEYMYQVLIGNGSKIPKEVKKYFVSQYFNIFHQPFLPENFDNQSEGLYMIRYHSFYPWHCSQDYDYLCNDEDRNMLKWVKEFNKFDLYSKADSLPDVEKIKPYYQSLIDKYCPGTLKW